MSDLLSDPAEDLPSDLTPQPVSSGTGPSPEAPRPKRTRADRAALRAAAIISMRNAGASYQAIAGALDEHTSFIGRVLRRAGLTGQPNHERERRDAEILYRRRVLGQSYATIEREMNLGSNGTVCRSAVRSASRATRRASTSAWRRRWASGDRATPTGQAR